MTRDQLGAWVVLTEDGPGTWRVVHVAGRSSSATALRDAADLRGFPQDDQPVIAVTELQARRDYPAAWAKWGDFLRKVGKELAALTRRFELYRPPPQGLKKLREENEQEIEHLEALLHVRRDIGRKLSMVYDRTTRDLIVGSLRLDARDAFEDEGGWFCVRCINGVRQMRWLTKEQAKEQAAIFNASLEWQKEEEVISSDEQAEIDDYMEACRVL
jgi:hypothetical protein